jgi:hypothetical protein
MNKKDFWTLVLFNLGTLILLIEHFCGVELALSFMCGWTIISLIAHILVLKDYLFTVTIEEE